MVDVATREHEAALERVADARRQSSVDTIKKIFYG
jgi:hypothetical protein